MKNTTKNLYKFLLFWLVVLPIYQDSPFSIFLGAAGYAVLMPLSLIFIVVYIVVKSRVPKNPRLTELMRLGYYLCCISFVSIIAWCALGNSLTVVGELLPIKAIKVCLQYFSYSAYIALVLICVRKVGTECLERYAYFTLLVLTGICLIELKQIPYALQAIHFAGTFPYWRVRLLTVESSWTAMMIYVYSIISLCYGVKIRKKSVVWSSVLCIGILILSSGSKTLMVSVAIILVLYVAFSLKHLNEKTQWKIMGGLFIGVLAIVVLSPTLIHAVQADIEQFTSIATRGYTALVSMGIGITIPIGVGGAVYLGVFQYALKKFLFLFNLLPVKLNVSEVESLAFSKTDAALTAKSGLLQRNMYWGIFGTMYLLHNFALVSKTLRKKRVKNNTLLRAAFWGAVILTTFACEFSFEFWLLYSYLICLNEATATEREKRCFLTS